MRFGQRMGPLLSRCVTPPALSVAEGTGEPRLLRQAHHVIPTAAARFSLPRRLSVRRAAKWRDRGSILPQRDGEWASGAPFKRRDDFGCPTLCAFCKGWALSPHSFSFPTLLFSENSKVITEYSKLLPPGHPLLCLLSLPSYFSKWYPGRVQTKFKPKPAPPN